MSAFRQPPRGLVRYLVRLPIWLYRARLGWLLNGRFLLLSHTGRTTGAVHQTVLEVVDHDRQSATYFVASGWGETSQWLRNIRASPGVEVTVGSRRFMAVAQILASDEAERILGAYARKHRIAMRALARLFGTDDVRILAGAIPVIALRAQTPDPRLGSLDT